MNLKEILSVLGERAFDNGKKLSFSLTPYEKWQQEAADITRSLDLVYKEQSPLPLPQNKKYGDPLLASNNAITHAYMSAKVAQLYGVPAAKALGDEREYRESPKGENKLRKESWDVYKDM
ncbi:hypothetical protein [Mesorhizobium sp. 1B3]|uniref:hypothetical protein n=1 Tax=Mesorhizobium sp. 1B3 TaxID=3243599 RepID=UPI003D965F58